MSILDEIGKNSLKKYLTNCNAYCSIDPERAFELILDLIKNHKGDYVPPEKLKEMRILENRWYKSLTDGNPDYSVYADPFYFCDVWLCWITYSRKYLKEIQNPKSLFINSIVADMKNVNTVLDLGCGFGYTTAGLKEIFPNSDVIGTNLAGTSQYYMATDLGNEHNFKVIDGYAKVKTDLIFASEYFEHIQNPIDHIQDVIKETSPRYLIIANTFTSDAIGHFKEYDYNGQKFAGKQMSMMFNKTLKNLGYEKVKTKCWNNRPTYWKKTK